MSASALLLAFRNHIRAKLGYSATECDLMPDGQPPASAGQRFVSVHPAPWAHDAPEFEFYEVSHGALVTVSMKSNALPADRVGTGLVALADTGLEDLAMDLARRCHLSYAIMAGANTIIGAGVNGFVEPARFLGADAPTPRREEWFSGQPPKGPASWAGWSITLRYGLCRRFCPNLTPAEDVAIGGDP